MKRQPVKTRLDLPKRVVKDTVVTCKCRYTLVNKAQGHIQEFRQKAIQLYIDGAELRRTRRQFVIHHQTVANWAKEEAKQLPETPVPAKVKAAEFDDLLTFTGDKKDRSYFITPVDRETRCFLGWKVDCERSHELVKASSMMMHPKASRS